LSGCFESILVGSLIGSSTIVDTTNTAPGATARGGTSEAPCANVVGFDACKSSGVTVLKEGTANYQIADLNGSTPYTLAIAAVDAFDNIGPPLQIICGLTVPGAGPQNRSGSCALEAPGIGSPSGMPLVPIAAVFMVRVRRRQRKDDHRDQGPRRVDLRASTS
jgi:hypothetical protein